MSTPAPRLVVLSILFPNQGQPHAGVFVRERMFKVGRHLPLTVVAPIPWFPFQGLIRRWRPAFRPSAPPVEAQSGFRVLHPRFLSVPGALKALDGWLLALGALPTMRRLKREGMLDIIDAHFAYPDGYAATLLGRWLKVPVTITVRGTEVSISRTRVRRRMMIAGLKRASRIVAVADDLKRRMVALGIDAGKIQVIGNGVDTGKFFPVDRAESRRTLGIPPDARVLISVGGLVERKGMHRVIECLPALTRSFPDLQYLIVGGAGGEGDWGPRLEAMVSMNGLTDTVRFLGPLPSDALRVPLSAADVFVLATRNEGWANVFLEAMACGLPVVTTRVGGNAEVVREPECGKLVEFGALDELRHAIAAALETPWDRAAIVSYAQANSWDSRVSALLDMFRQVARSA